MFRHLFILLLTLLLLPSIGNAQVKAMESKDSIMELNRKAELEKRRLQMAKEEAKRRAEEEKKQSAKSKVKTEGSQKGNNGVTGLMLLKIPVNGPYYLGMLKHHYDSTARANAISVTVENQTYPFKLFPHFYFGRLSVLGLTLPDSIFSNDLSDLITYYEKKFGAADEKKISDSLMIFPAEEGAALQGEYRVKEATLTWYFTTHNVVIRSRLTDRKDSTWNGFFLITYAGTAAYLKGLSGLQEKERMIEQ